MPPLSLGALCRKTAVANIDELSYVSYLPYSRVKDILVHVRNDQQLNDIEEASPQIKGETDELWEVLARKKFLVQLKKMKKLNNDLPLEIDSWKVLYWQLRKEDDEREAQALAHLKKTLTTLNESKDRVKANLADPRRLPKRPRETSTYFLSAPAHYFSNHHNKDTLVQKARKEADKMVNNRQLAIKARMTPKKALETVPKGLTEAIRIRRQPIIPLRNDNRAKKEEKQLSESEYEERAKREARLLSAQKPQKLSNDGIHMPGTTIPNSLETVLKDTRKPATTAGLPAPPKPAAQPTRKSSVQFGSSLFTCPPDLQKPHSRVKMVTSTTPKLSTSNSTNGGKARPGSSNGLSASASASSPSAKSTTETDDDDDLFGEKETPKKPVAMTPGSPSKRPFSMVAGSSDNSNSTAGLASTGGQPPRKKKKATGIFMPTKRTR